MSETAFLPDRPPLFLSDDDVAALSDWPSAVEALAAAYAEQEIPGSTPARAQAAMRAGFLRVMPSAPTGRRLMGSKTISAAIRNRQVSYLVSLFDQDTSSLVALLDGNRITGIRTAATAAVAVRALTPDRPLTVAVIGSGFEARAQLAAVATVRSLASVRVFSPTERNRIAFAEEHTASLGSTVAPAASARDAAEGADLVLCAARSRDESPTMYAGWLSPHATVVSVGSTTASQRELDVDVIEAASLIVADAVEEVLHDSGDLLAAREAGIAADNKTVSLTAALRGDAPRPKDGIAVYKSTGSGFQDIVLSELLYDRAVAAGRGTELPVNVLTVRK